MTKSPRSKARNIGFIALVVIGVLIYAYGWQATDIDLDVAQDEGRQERVVRALRGLLNPILFERDTESEVAYAYFLVPCTDESPEQPDVVEGEPYVELTPDCGEASDLITVEVFGFRPYSDGYIRWTPPGRSTQTRNRFRTDGDGHFRSSELRVPTASESDELQVIEVEVQWPVGAPRPSEALTTTIERMIETIFLALMATTLGLVVAIPVSFLAAFNLMRPIRKPLGSLLATLLPLLLYALLIQRLKALGAPDVLVDWLSLRPLIEQAYNFGNMGWIGAGILLVLAAGSYVIIFRLLPNPHDVSRRGKTVRYLRLALGASSLLTGAAIASGVGNQLAIAVSGVLGGVLSSVVGTVSTFVVLMLPGVTGLVFAVVLGTLLSGLVESLVGRLQGTAARRALGLMLGAAAGGLLLYLGYTAIFNFYNPGDPMPLLWEITAAGGVLGGIGGLVLGADHSLPLGLIIYYVVRTILNGLRSIEPLIMGIVFVIWVGIGPFAGVLALALHSIAALGKLYSEQVESIDPGPIEAITATGATRLQMIRYGVVPQIVPPYIAFTLYRWDINVRMSTIIGFVGGGGIGFVLQQWINLLQYREAGVAVLAIAIVVAALDYASAKAREKIT
jgi:phosphonate ABC transporter permease subunit PhnE